LFDAFWDASALVPLSLREAASPQARALAAQYSMVVWWATLAEMHGAIARVERSGQLSALATQAARQVVAALKGDWKEIVPSLALRDRACQLLASHPLRTADSLQLAAATVWCGNRPAGRTFLSGDLRLCEAAAIEGFTVIQVKP
jgi:predicted nucleic acid-binding protein